MPLRIHLTFGSESDAKLVRTWIAGCAVGQQEARRELRRTLHDCDSDPGSPETATSGPALLRGQGHYFDGRHVEDEESTEVYGVGAFLLAGSEVYRLVGGSRRAASGATDGKPAFRLAALFIASTLNRELAE